MGENIIIACHIAFGFVSDIIYALEVKDDTEISVYLLVELSSKVHLPRTVPSL